MDTGAQDVELDLGLDVTARPRRGWPRGGQPLGSGRQLPPPGQG